MDEKIVFLWNPGRRSMALYGGIQTEETTVVVSSKGRDSRSTIKV